VHKWLTAEEIECMEETLVGLEERLIAAPLFAPDMRRLIADRRETRKLLRRVVFGDIFMDLRLALSDISDMLEATADD